MKRKRYIIALLPLLLTLTLTYSSYSQKVSGTLSGSVSANFLLGTQLKGLKIGASVFGTATYKQISVEGGVSYSVSRGIQKFGVYEKNWARNFEVFALGGYGKNDNLLGSNLGFVNHLAFYNQDTKDNFFYGVGGSIEIFKVSGELKKFENNNGAFLFRLSKSENSFSFNFSNDAKAPFIPYGSDKGITARILLNFVRIHNNELLGFGLGLDMFTPEADYSRVPQNPINSDDGTETVSFTTKPFENLYHLNLYTSLVYQSDKFSIDTKVGIDSPKAGAYFQNLFHDSFALYPRFGWPVTKKAQFYGLVNAKAPFEMSY